MMRRMSSVRAVFTNSREQRQVAGGSTIFRQGDAGREMYGVIDGEVELRDGDAVVARIAPGDTFGEMAIISDAPRSLTAVAGRDTTLAVIDEQTFLFLVHETPMFAINVMRSLADRVRDHDPR